MLYEKPTTIPSYHQDVREAFELRWRGWECVTCGAVWSCIEEEIAEGDGYCLGVAFANDLH